MAPRQPGKRALKAQREARRADLSSRLADLLRALGHGASAAAGMLELGRAGDEAGLRAALARYSGRTEAELRRQHEAESLVRELSALQES